jgi:hypothetical protein
MQRTWRIFALSTLMVVPLATDPNRAVAGQEKTSDKGPDLGTIAKKLDDINNSLKTLGDLKTSVADIDARVRALDRLVQEQLERLRGGAYETNLKVEKAQADIQDLKRQLTQIQQNLDALNKTAAAPQTRISGYQGPAGPAPITGRVRMVNTFNRTMTVRVNNLVYEVPPGTERLSEPLPPGTFTYEVLGVTLPQERPLAAGETFTVTVYPR